VIAFSDIDKQIAVVLFLAFSISAAIWVCLVQGLSFVIRQLIGMRTLDAEYYRNRSISSHSDSQQLDGRNRDAAQPEAAPRIPDRPRRNEHRPRLDVALPPIGRLQWQSADPAESAGYEALIAPTRTELRRQVFDGAGDSGYRVPGAFATFQGNDGELFLLFRHEGLLEYTDYEPTLADERRTGLAHILTPTVLSVRAGQIVRVIDSVNSDPMPNQGASIRADRCTVRVSPPYAAERLVKADPPAMARFFRRSSDEAAFWTAIIESPDVEVRRLIYADYLDEEGDSAGLIFRGDLPFILHYRVWGVGDWDERNCQRACWSLVLSEFRALGPRSDVRTEPGYRSFSAYQHGGNRDEWRCLTVSSIDGADLPPFVNYILLQQIVPNRLNPFVVARDTSAS
jgi:uncharacterized protein (TIGR02996 family)